MRFFRVDADTYERVRLAIDADRGWPDDGTRTSIEPAATAPRDAAGRVLLALEDWLVPVAGMHLADLEQIDEATFEAAKISGE